ncbi:hypothetical protein [Epilithonimonas lactis]|uniref:Uncharacterized protein n=1 Tax=Epilithonimonas lactis TaxID=421072 RepID=A0A085BG95_9FLAO|nr:hypothetical protein [Epilithonimonas lactis]KFC21490.1 hypothetical protein IO89_15045 [Epilithonimonas lactis]SEP86948.1 hypothetical protein SAMN04488097_0918 [Epilithonimonas lactis]
MKIFLTVFSFGVCTLTSAQVAIGKKSVTNASVLLEFGDENKGIILPQVLSSKSSIGGTFIYSAKDRSVQVWEGRANSGNGGWTDLTKNETSGINHNFINSGHDVASAKGAIIGNSSTNKDGVLILESSLRALVLPGVSSPNLNMKGAVAGTMVYDRESDTLALYDGVNWSYWK